MLKWSRFIPVVLCLLVIGTAPVRAAPIHAQSTQAQGPNDAEEVEAFFDGMIESQFRANHIAGAEVVVVKDGEVLFIKGYGEANLEEHIPVDPERTFFRPGSVSKLFTWTAVMQLVEQGMLDLNADVNTYLSDFKIPETYPQPITMLDLMNHTPGFEERGINTITLDAGKILPLGQYLAEYMPARVRPPGEISSYSNYGAALAGYIVEQVSGVPFDEYVQVNIFEPLGMERSTFSQPLPEALAADMSVGYTFETGYYQPHEFEIILPYPAGSLSSTAADLSKFMIAHLQLGQYGDARILQESTAREMQQQTFTHDPNVSGFAHGFMEIDLNEEHAIWHGGDTIYFHSALVLFPSQNMGFYVTYNSQDGGSATGNTLQAFFDHYFPVANPPEQLPVTGSGQEIAEYAGSYRASRSSYTTIEKILGLFGPVNVTRLDGPPENGQLQISGLGGEVSRWVEEGQGVFRSLDPGTPDNIVFGKDENGQQYMFSELNPSVAYIKLPWYSAAFFNYGLLAVCIVLFLSMFLAAPVALFLSRRKAQGAGPSTARLARWLVWIYCALTIIFIIGFLLIATDPNIVFGYPPEMTLLLYIPLITTALALALVVFTVLAWKDRYWTLPGRIHYTLVTLAALAFAWFLYFWNIIPPRL